MPCSATGPSVTYVGALGTRPCTRSSPHRARAKVVSLCDAAHTTAVEFTDGKLMLGQMRSLDEITYDRICAVMGEASFLAELGAADLVAFVNWTMIPEHDRDL
jgi:hypothetical protein